jgi:hypothetical protein
VQAQICHHHGEHEENCVSNPDKKGGGFIVKKTKTIYELCYRRGKCKAVKTKSILILLRVCDKRESIKTNNRETEELLIFV